MKKYVATAVFCIAVLLGGMTSASATDIDLLVNKLVEKGVLTQGEAQQLVTETKEDIRRQNAEGTNESLPSWLQKTKFSGDMRVRYQGEEHSSAPNPAQANHRDRGRFRLRYGFDMKPNDLMHVGFRMATGENKMSGTTAAGPELTSTNQSFTNTFNNKWIWVDQAYVDYVPFGHTSLPILKDTKLIGGKFPNPFYTTDMVWDPDINPEGGVIQISPTFGTLKPFATFGFLPMGESSADNNDPYIWAGQLGLSGVLMNRPFKVAGAYYDFQHVKGMTTTTYTGGWAPTFTNSATGIGLLQYAFNVIEGTAEFSPIDVSIPFVDNPMPLTIMGDYAYNAGKADDTIDPKTPKYNTAWLIGAKIGKASGKGTWEAFYNFREIGRDAVYSWINDSDFHLGGTASMGHKFGLTYAIMPSSTISATCFITRPYKYVLASTANTSNNINIIMLDWVTKF